MIRLGPAGFGGVKEAKGNLEDYHKNKITACEIAFTYQIYLNNTQAKEIGKIADKNNISLSIHAPYWINLNSKEKRKIEQSKQRILKCCEIAHHLNAKYVVFHPGFYSGMEKEESFNNIKEAINDMQSQIKGYKWKVKLAPETMGKINVFGSIDEIMDLVKETKSAFCFDFAHSKAHSQGKESYGEMLKKIKKFKHIHSHFSGIEWTKKGEKRHIITPEKEIKSLGKALKDNHIKNITIINESPSPVSDSIKTINIFKKLKLL